MARVRLTMAVMAAGLAALAPLGALMGQNASAPSPSALYQARTDCHVAYDLLISEIDAGRTPSAQDEAWARAHENAGNAGQPCTPPNASLAQRAANRAIATPDGESAARKFLERQQDPVAMAELGIAYYSSMFGDGRRQEGLNLIRQASGKGDAQAQFMYGVLLMQGAYGQRDQKGGFAAIQRAADSGHIDAQFRAGVFNLEGVGTRKDERKAFDLFRRAAESGHSYAAVMAFNLINEGRGAPKDFDLAYRLGRNLASKGEVYGAVMAASALLQGRNPAARETEILYWMDQAAARGNAAIRTQIAPLRQQAVQLFARRSAPASYRPEPRRACPMKTTCLVNHFTGLQQCTTAKDYWSDCDG